MTCPICGAEHEVTEGPSGLKIAACPKMTEADGWYLISQSNVVERDGTLVAGEAIANRARNLPGPTWCTCDKKREPHILHSHPELGDCVGWWS